MYSSFPVRESLGLISYMTASQPTGLSPVTHYCYFIFSIIEAVIYAKGGDAYVITAPQRD